MTSTDLWSKTIVVCQQFPLKLDICCEFVDRISMLIMAGINLDWFTALKHIHLPHTPVGIHVFLADQMRPSS